MCTHARGESICAIVRRTPSLVAADLRTEGALGALVIGSVRGEPRRRSQTLMSWLSFLSRVDELGSTALFMAKHSLRSSRKRNRNGSNISAVLDRDGCTRFSRGARFSSTTAPSLVCAPQQRPCTETSPHRSRYALSGLVLCTPGRKRTAPHSLTIRAGPAGLRCCCQGLSTLCSRSAIAPPCRARRLEVLASIDLDDEDASLLAVTMTGEPFDRIRAARRLGESLLNRLGDPDLERVD